MAPERREFWQKHPGLVWSNSAAPDHVYIRAALLRPRFSELLDIALEFGLERVEQEWAELQLDDTHEVRRATPMVERILSNLGKGFQIAASGN